MPSKTPFNLLVAVTLALSCSVPYRLAERDLVSPSAWPFHRGDLASRGNLDGGRFNGKLDVVWERKRGEKPAGPLTLFNGMLIYPGTKNKIRFYDALTGDKLGHFKSHGAAQTGVVVGDSLVFYATSPRKGWLRCVHLGSGRQLWKLRVKDAAEGTIIVDNKLIVGSSDGSLKAYRTEDGKVIWTYQADGGFVAPASFAIGRVFQPCDNGMLYVLSATDGSELYRTPVGGPMLSSVAVSRMAYAADVSGGVYAIDPEQGHIVWESRLDGPIWTAPAVADGRLFVGHSRGELVALDASDGKILWRFDVGGVVRASATIVNGYVIVGTMAGELFSLKAVDGTLVERRQLDGAVTRSPVSDGSYVYVATESGMIVSFGQENDNIR